MGNSDMRLFDNDQAVVRTDDFNIGDLAAYVCPDNVLPDRPEYAFLKGKLRIKAQKLRGIVSQGLVLPAPPDAVEGSDVAEFLGATHYVSRMKGHGSGGGGWTGDQCADPPYPGEKYDIDSWFRYSSLLEDGLYVELSEHAYGCLSANSRIFMADGTTEMLGVLVNQNRVGEEVLGVDTEGNIVPTTILKVFNNGATQDWLKVQGTRHGCGRGSSYFSLYCTPSHEFYCPASKSYLPAEDLKIGSRILLYRSEYTLSPTQRAVLLGKMLGDGSLAYNTHSASVAFGHKQQHRAYLEWTMQGLGTLAGPWRGERVSGYGTKMLRARTIQRAEVFEYLRDFIDVNGEKHLPQWVVNEMTPLALAFWYMDDGSLSHANGQEDRASFAVCAFNEQDCHILLHALQQYGIDAQYYIAEGYPRLRLNADDAEKFFLLVAPYIPPVMQYKLPFRYRGHSGWLPNPTNEYKSVLSEQAVTSVGHVMTPSGTKSPVRYDMETATHNFFANGVLVHNSNTRA
jgi:recombination protein RecA